MSTPDPMQNVVHAFPDMLEEAYSATLPDRFELQDGRSCLLGGMGGSGMACAVGAILMQESKRIAISWRNAKLPAWLDSSDRVVIVSYSGDTWEARSMLTDAIDRSIPTRVITCGGQIKSQCDDASIPIFTVPPGMQPRASLPWLCVGVLRAISEVEPEEIRTAASALRAERESSIPGRDPDRLASEMEGRLVVFLPIGPKMEVVAARWRNQLLENAEASAIVSPLPEMCHNEIMGWPHLSELGVPISFFVLAESPGPSGVFSSVVAALEDEAAGCGHSFHVIPPNPIEGLGSLLAEIYLADRVSVRLADRRGRDATPVAAIERLRKAMARHRNL